MADATAAMRALHCKCGSHKNAIHSFIALQGGQDAHLAELPGGLVPLA